MRMIPVLVVLLTLLTVSVVAAASGPPSWLVQAAQQTAARLSDGTAPASIRYLAPRSRFPRVVLTGSFVCNDCSHGSGGAPAPKGTVAELRFDGETHLSLDFALCKSGARCAVSLCSFGSCTRAQVALDAAFALLDARLRGIPGDPDPFTHRQGSFSCHIHYPVAEMRYIVGSCTTALRFLGAQTAEVTLSEHWRPREFEHSRWVKLPTRTHSWQMVETDGGWRVAITSSGDAAPQLPTGDRR